MTRFFLAALVAAHLAVAGGRTIPLAGTWGFQLDSENAGHEQRWYERRLDAHSIFLPGSTDQGGYGTKLEQPEKGWLTRPYKYAGAAWYQKEVVIPEVWRGRRITLFLERPHWQTEVWVDGRAFGTANSLSTPHVYDLTEGLAPGPHRLTMCVDNSYKIDVGRDAHSVADHTQTNWNGIVGIIELRASDAVWIDSVRIFADAGSKRMRVTGVIGSRTGEAMEGDLSASVPGLAGATARMHWTSGGAETPFELELPAAGARLWDEYEGSLYRLELSLSAQAGPRRFADRREVSFGLRRISTSGTQFTLNGRPIFLRGTLECNIFPLTGYPAMDVAGWERLFRIARSYGLNAFRFHSYCPPEAAFLAADRAGFLLHVELPVWNRTVGKDPVLDEYMRAEGYRILTAYGNHPSFTMLCLGNELSGDDAFIDALVAEFKSSDPRRLYTFSADHRRRAPGPTSDYWVTQQTSVGRLRLNGTRFTKAEEGTDLDFSPSVKAFPLPLVSHEMGQWAVFPSFAEIAKYTGVLKARNQEVFRNQMEGRGMLDQAAGFQEASGKFAWSVYKEDMEAALRTPNYGGFFLLQLQDFPGQGKALVGLLDSFWDSKGIMTPEEFRRFSSETVPLLRMKKFVWTAGEAFVAKAEVAHYGRKPIANAAAAWSVTDDGGRVLQSGAFPRANLPLGSVTPLGDINLRLDAVARAAHWKISIQVRGTEARNDWDMWVYPKAVETKPPANVLVTSALDAARRALDEGRRVVFLVPPKQKSDSWQPMKFLPVFWSNGWFRDQPDTTMGILCDPSDPALADFPTAMYADFHWWELMEGGQAFLLNGTPAGFRPVIQVIDDFHRNRKMGAVFEASVGKGKLLAVSFDLATNLDGRPVARQLLHSLLAFAGSERFEPRDRLAAEDVGKLAK